MNADELYLELSALLPFRKSIENEASQLSEKSKRSRQEQSRLEELNQQLEKFNYLDLNSGLLSGHKEKANLEEQKNILEMDNSKLKREIRKLKKSTQ